MITKLCLRLAEGNKPVISGPIVGVFSNYGASAMMDSASGEDRKYQKEILLKNYENILIRAQDNNETVLVSANNTYFLDVYDEFKGSVKLILLVTESNMERAECYRSNFNVMLIEMDMDADTGLSRPYQELLEDAVIINYALKVCDTFLVYSVEDFSVAIPTVAVAESYFASKKLRFTEVKPDYIIAGDPDSILEDSTYCSDLLSVYRDLGNPIFTYNNYNLFNIVNDQMFFGRDKEFAPFLDTYHDLRFNLYSKVHKDIPLVKGF